MADEPHKGGGERAGGGLRRGLATLVIILGILWVTLFFAVGTKGGLDLVQSQLSKRLGTPVKVARARLAVPAALRLMALESENYAEGELGFRADEVRLALGTRPWLRVTLMRPELNLVHDGLTWYPTNFAALGELPEGDLQGLTALSAGWRERVALAIEDGQCTWYRDVGAPLAAARGIMFQIEPVALPGHAGATYQRLRAMSVEEVDGRRTDNVDVEWLTVDGDRHVELSRAPTMPAAEAGGFWGVVNDATSGD